MFEHVSSLSLIKKKKKGGGVSSLSIIQFDLDARFMQEKLLSQVLEAFIVIRGLIVQKTKLISDCNRLLKDLIDSLLLESNENKRQFIRACISGLQIHGEERKGRTSLVWSKNTWCFILLLSFIIIFFTIIQKHSYYDNR